MMIILSRERPLAQFTGKVFTQYAPVGRLFDMPLNFIALPK